jgi:hypothetical protein
MQRAIVIVLLFLSFGLKAQVYQAMPQAGYGPVKRFLTDSVLTIPTGINSLRNITGGRDAGQIRWNTTDSGFYVYSGTQWIKINIDSVSLSNRINGKLNISDTATMLSAYLRKGDTLSLSNRINLRVKYSDTAAMLSAYLLKLDTASLSDRINKKMDSLILTTIGTGGLATLLGTTLNIPNYGGALTGYVPYSGATNNVTLGSYNLTGTLLNADYSLQIKNEVGAGGASTLGYTSISSNNSGYYFYTSYTGGQKGAYFNYPTSGTTFSYNLPVRAGTLALVEDTVSLSNRINSKIGASDTVSLSNRINLKVNISDTASMLSPYLRKADTSSLSNRINLKLNASDTASLSNRIDLRVKYSDTASMLSGYQSAINARVKYSDTAAMLDPYLTAAVTSVGLSMPVAFSVANSPITSTGTLAVSAIGTAAQYIRGDGQLATLPSGSSGGSSVDYYLNGGTSQGTIGGSTYYEMSKDAVIGTNADFNRTNAQGNGLIAQFITDAGDPNRIEIPTGAWNFELFFNASSSGGSPSYYIELLKYNGTTFTSIASGSAVPERITTGTTTDLYLSSLAVPYTTLLVTDRLVIRVYVVTSGRTITLHTQDGHLCLITTTFAGGVSSLNGLTANTQYLAVGTSGTDFAINSLVDTHTFNLPTASATNRGALSSADWTTFNGKMNYSDTVSLSNRINTKLNSADTASLSNRINAKADALSGTTNTVAKFTSSTTIGNSNIKDNGNAVSINTTAAGFGALQVGDYNGGIMINKGSGAALIFKNTLSSDKLWDINPVGNDLSIDESNVSPPRMYLQAGGNVGINLTTPTKTLDINGTIKVSDTAYFGNKLSNGTYTYTLPSATGTLALTSAFDTTSLSNRINLKLNISDTASMLNGYQSAINSKQPQLNGTGFVKASGTTISYDNSTYATTSSLSGYLPLTGGTLTGALGGTSATFSGTINSTVGNNGALLSATTATTGYQYIDIITTSGRTQLIQESSVAGTTVTNSTAYASMFGSAVAKDVILFTNGANRLKLDGSTGAATFTGNNATNTTENSSVSWNDLNGNLMGKIVGYRGVNGNDGNLRFYTSNTSTLALTLASTGAATFSNDVTVSSASTNGFIVNSTSGASFRGFKIQHNGSTNAGFEADANTGQIKIGGYFNTGDYFPVIYSDGVAALTFGIGASPSATFVSLGTGTVTASSGTLSTVSDSSYKIADGFIEDALPSVMNLKPRYFYWKDKSGLDTTIRQLGFYAQEVNSAIGEEAANTPKKDSPWGINDRSVIAMLTKAIQEQQAQIKDLQTEIQTLKNK